MDDLVERCLSAADDLDAMPSNYDARCARLDHGAHALREAAARIRQLEAELAALKDACEPVVTAVNRAARGEVDLREIVVLMENNFNPDPLLNIAALVRGDHRATPAGGE